MALAFSSWCCCCRCCRATLMPAPPVACQSTKQCLFLIVSFFRCFKCFLPARSSSYRLQTAYRSRPLCFSLLSQMHENKKRTMLLPLQLYSANLSPSFFVRSGTPRTQVSIAQDLAHIARVWPGQGSGSRPAPHAARPRFRGLSPQGRQVLTSQLSKSPYHTHQSTQRRSPKQTQHNPRPY